MSDEEGDITVLLEVAREPCHCLTWLRRPLVRRQVELVVIFGFLLVCILLGCTISPSPFISVAFVVALAVCIGAIRYPHLALLLVFAGAGMPSLLLHLPGQSLHMVEPPLLLCMLVIFLRHANLRLSLPHLFALLFLAMSVISFIHVPEIAPNAYSADKRLLVLMVVFLAFFCGSFLADFVKHASSFLVAVLLTNIPLYLIALAQYLGLHLPSLLEASGAQDPRIAQGRLWGPFPWSTTFAAYLINLFAIALACWILGTRRRYRMVGFMMAIVTALAIVGSGTRTVAVVAGVLIVVTLIIARRWKTLYGTVILVGIILAVSFNHIWPRFIHDPYSTSNRLFLWNEALKLIIAHPLIGIGLQQFRFYYAQLIISPIARLNPNGVGPHQQYLEWALESGIVSLVFGILLLLSMIVSYCQAYRVAQREQRVLLLAALLAVIANSLIGLLDVPLDPVEGSTFFFLLTGLALGYAGHIRQMASPRNSSLASHRSSLPRRLERSKVAHKCDQTSSKRSTQKLSAPNLQKTGRSIVIQLVSWGIALPILLPMTALLTRYLGPVQYGEYSLTFPFLTIFALLSGTGMDPLIIRQLSRQPYKNWSEILSYATGTRLVSTLLSMMVAAGLALVLPIGAEQRNLFLVGSLSLLFSFSFNGLRIIYSHGFRAQQQVGLLSLLETSNRLFTAVLVALIVALRIPLFWAYVLLICSDLPAFVIQVIVARQRFALRVYFSLTRFREHMLGGLPLMGHSLLLLVSGQADLLVLMAMVGPLSVGIFALASRVTDPLISMALAYVNGLYPLLCTKFEEGHEQFSKIYHEAIRIMALVIVPLAIFVTTEAHAIVIVLGGQQFAASTTVVQLLMWAMVCTFFNQVSERACMATNLERRIPLVTITTASINIVANLVLIPHWQVVGAGVASLVSECIGLGMFTALLRLHSNLLSIIRMLLLVFLSNLPGLVLLLWQPQASPWLMVTMALLLTLVAYKATGVLSLKDLAKVAQIVFAQRHKKATKHVVGLFEQSKDMTEQPTLILPQISV